MKLRIFLFFLFLPFASFTMFIARRTGALPKQSTQQYPHSHNSENRNNYLIRLVVHEPTPFLLHQITKEKDDQLLKDSLLKGLKPHINTPHGDNNALFVATKEAYVGGVNILIGNGANVNAQNESKRTALVQTVISLCDYNSPDQVDKLMSILMALKRAGAQPNITDCYNHTAQDYLCQAFKIIDEMRSRTMKHENGHLVYLYTEIQELLKE